MPTVGSHRGLRFGQQQSAKTPAHSMGPGVPYGSVSMVGPLTDARQRSRDRARDARGRGDTRLGASAPPTRRNRSMGPQEISDWQEAFTNMNDRINALENYNRTNGQKLSQLQGTLNEVKDVVKVIGDDYPLYKDYVQKRFHTICTATENKVGEHEKVLKTVSENFTVCDRMLRGFEDTTAALMTSVERLNSAFAELQQPAAQQFNISTPAMLPPAAPPGIATETGQAFPQCGQPDGIPHPAAEQISKSHPSACL